MLERIAAAESSSSDEPRSALTARILVLTQVAQIVSAQHFVRVNTPRELHTLQTLASDDRGSELSELSAEPSSEPSSAADEGEQLSWRG